MWILKFLPYWLFYAILLIGLVGLLVSKFIPGYYRTAVQGIAVGMIVLGLYMSGAISNEESWQAKVRELEVKVAEAEAQAGKVTIQIVEKVVTQTRVVREKGKDIVQYVDREIVKFDNKCEIPTEFVDIINKAAEKAQ